MELNNRKPQPDALDLYLQQHIGKARESWLADLPSDADLPDRITSLDFDRRMNALRAPRYRRPSLSGIAAAVALFAFCGMTIHAAAQPSMQTDLQIQGSAFYQSFRFEGLDPENRLPADLLVDALPENLTESVCRQGEGWIQLDYTPGGIPPADATQPGDLRIFAQWFGPSVVSRSTNPDNVTVEAVDIHGHPAALVCDPDGSLHLSFGLDGFLVDLWSDVLPADELCAVAQSIRFQ